MRASSRFPSGRVLIIGFAIGLAGPGVQAASQVPACPADLHALHEAREDCDRNRRAYDHAQHEADEATARAKEKRARAAELAENMCFAGEPVANVKSETEVTRTKPEGASEIQNRQATATLFGLSVVDIYDRGVMVTDVDLGSVAGKLGIHQGDVILAVNGEPVTSTDDFQKFVRQVAGGPIIFTVSRLGQVNLFMIDAYER